MISKTFISDDEFFDFEVVASSPTESHREVVHCFAQAIQYARRRYYFLYERMLRGEQCSVTIRPVQKPLGIF